MRIEKWWSPETKRYTVVELLILTLKDARNSTQWSIGYDRSLGKISFVCAIWGLFAIFLTYEGRFAPQWKSNLPFNKQAKELSIRFHHGAMWINLWENPDGWCKTCRQWSFNFMDILFGQKQSRKIVLRDEQVTVAFPEKEYELIATVYTMSFWRPRLPNKIKTYRYIELATEEGIPIPGKGESAWDLGDDAIFSQSIKTDTIYEAKKSLVDSVINRRLKYGGTNWTPESKEN